jgi:hypothetical protein
MQVTLASRHSPDTASNEDFITATAGVVVVIDGASVPARASAKSRFVRFVPPAALAPVQVAGSSRAAS